MKDTLTAGLEHTFSFTVTREKTVPFVYPESDLFREMPEVFATAFMVGFMEWACMEALRPYLEEGERTLGTMINVTHQAATPPGMQVTARVKCIEADGKRTLWEVEVSDEVEVIGKGTHERFVVSHDKFSARVAAKGQQKS
ncbi:MAG: thioesterase family protein [Desulfuromonadales bacterium]|nr:thioesterase family protein [Desulfuromonadales bacterium]